MFFFLVMVQVVKIFHKLEKNRPVSILLRADNLFNKLDGPTFIRCSERKWPLSMSLANSLSRKLSLTVSHALTPPLSSSPSPSCYFSFPYTSIKNNRGRERKSKCPCVCLCVSGVRHTLHITRMTR